LQGTRIFIFGLSCQAHIKYNFRNNFHKALAKHAILFLIESFVFY